MRITYKLEPTDPLFPIMHGESPMSKEFNRRQERLLREGKLEEVNYVQISTVLFEILCDDYNKRHASRKRKKQAITPKNENQG